MALFGGGAEKRKKERAEFAIGQARQRGYFDPTPQEIQQKSAKEEAQHALFREGAVKREEEMRGTREAGRERGRAYGEEVMGRDVRGLTPRQRQSMEESSQQKINRQMQGYQRSLVGQQGGRGIRGGAAYAQQADLARTGLEQQQQTLRDINQMDADIALKKLAAQFGIESGEAAQSQYDRQRAEDQLRMEDKMKRQRGYGRGFQQSYQRV